MEIHERNHGAKTSEGSFSINHFNITTFDTGRSNYLGRPVFVKGRPNLLGLSNNEVII